MKSKFHLIIPARERSINLCKTLLSAAILNYPPPTLIGFELEEKEEQDSSLSQSIQDTLNFLIRKDVQDDDIVLIVDQDTWLQLPVEMIIGRFLNNVRDSSASLLKQYGRVDADSSIGNERKSGPLRSQRYTQKVLFAAQKACNIELSAEAECYANIIPQSPLPKRIYGSERDKREWDTYNHPRYIQGSLAIGEAGDIKRIWSRASELSQLQHQHKEDITIQNIMTQMFGEQEWNRVQNYKKSSSKFRIWLEEKLGYGVGGYALGANNITLRMTNPEGNYEFGMGIDYESEIFQTMWKSKDDVRFVGYGEMEREREKWKGTMRRRGIIQGAIKDPATLLAEFDVIGGPLELCGGKDWDANKEEENVIDEVDKSLIEAQKQNISWKDVQLATNTIMPHNLVPASLNFNFFGDDRDGEEIKRELWGNMWWGKWARALLRKCGNSNGGEQSWRNVGGGVGEGEGKGKIWWDERGGRRGVWTGERVWVEWGEVCGEEEFEGEIFVDG